MILLDSSFLVAFYNDSDRFHRDAVDVMEDLVSNRWDEALLLDYVFLEVVTVLAARLHRSSAVEAGLLLLDAREIRQVNGSDFFLDAFDVFRGPEGGSLSFTDAAIVAAARRLEAGHVATFDSDFRGIQGLAVVPD